MSFKGGLEACCPNGCPPFDTEVWSFIRGDRDPELRETIMARECNLLLCPSCDKPFYAEAPYVYFEPAAELLAFVFPESYAGRKDYWLGKMRDDFSQMRDALGAGMTAAVEPEVFFGVEGLAELLAAEDFRGAETEVMEAVAKELGLGLYQVSPSFARRQKVPRSLPSSNPRAADRDSVIEGLKKLLKANASLSSFKAFLKTLEKPGAAMPPSAQRQS
ncbi:MAG: hypothetical protein HY924_00275 [Elusimicrobia bacterium]|nr:hypothetical protein [Elusimicrobiota bacterium]